MSIHANRITKRRVVSVETAREMEADLTKTAAQILPGGPLKVIAFGCASCTMTIGDARVVALLRETRPGLAVTDAITASLIGLEALGVRRIAMLTPWADDVNRFGESYIANRGFEIPVKGSFKQTDDYEIHRISPEAVYDAGLELGRADVDGLLISGTGLKVSPILESLEDALRKPVITSTQSIAWQSLRLAGIDDPVAGYGKLLRT